MFHALAAIANGAPPSSNGAAASNNGAAASGNVTGSAQINANTISLNDQAKQILNAVSAGTFAFAVTIDDKPKADEHRHIQAEPYKQKKLQPAKLSPERTEAFQRTISELDLSQPPPLTSEFQALMQTEERDSNDSDAENEADDESDTNMVHV